MLQSPLGKRGPGAFALASDWDARERGLCLGKQNRTALWTETIKGRSGKTLPVRPQHQIDRDRTVNATLVTLPQCLV